MYELLTCVMARLGDTAELGKELKKPLFEAIGHLTGIEEGYVTQGSKKFADSLHAIIEHWPADVPNEEMYTLLSNCTRYGFAVDGQPLGAGVGRRRAAERDLGGP